MTKMCQIRTLRTSLRTLDFKSIPVFLGELEICIPAIFGEIRDFITCIGQENKLVDALKQI